MTGESGSEGVPGLIERLLHEDNEPDNLNEEDYL